MSKHYPWLWFDADGTLFDYNQAESGALESTFQSLQIPFEENHLAVYRRINQQLWQAFERQEIMPDVLQVRRFELLLETLDLQVSPDLLSSTFIERLALQTALIDGALDVLEALRGKSRIAIVTNGLKNVQPSRLALSPIGKFISALIISEEVGAAKPSPLFFEAASASTGNPPKDGVLLIGDSLSSDMRGGVDYGLDTCWFNPDGLAQPDGLAITYEISHLRQLLDIVA